MPTKSYYDLANDENFDIKIPAYPEEAFQQGIRFCAKYIGTQDISRPASRVEIVAAMRHIRYEYKAKGVKKRNAVLSISVSGIEVYYQKRRRKAPIVDDNCVLLMKHPTYRVFYVSHDSQDLKILSYIARDSGSNVFRCSVFKAHKNNDAILIVRTIGQAFEVCHKQNQQSRDTDSQREDNQSDKSATALTRDSVANCNERLPNSDSMHSASATSNTLSSRSTVNGTSLRKSESIGSAPEASSVSASSTATNGFMQNSVYSSGSVPNAFVTLLSQSAANSAPATDARTDAHGNVETAIKTAHELLNFATVACRKPNNSVNTPGTLSVTTSFHESTSVPRSPTCLPTEALLNGLASQNYSVPTLNGGNTLSATTSNGSMANASLVNGSYSQTHSHSAVLDRLHSVDRFVSDSLLPSGGTPNVLTAIAEAKQRLLEEQLVQETAIRIETQTRVQQLLVINKQLTQHIYRLSERVQQLQADLSRLQGSAGEANNTVSEHAQSQSSQTNSMVQSSHTLHSTGSIDIPRLDPPPQSLHRQVRISVGKKTMSRDSSSTSIVERSGSKMTNTDSSQQTQIAFNNLELSMRYSSQTAQIPTRK